MLCRRSKAPNKGRYDLIGSHAEPEEDNLAAAYRTLEEHCALFRRDIVLHHLMNFSYYFQGRTLEVYAGCLEKATTDRLAMDAGFYWLSVQNYRYYGGCFPDDGSKNIILDYILQQLNSGSIRL